AIADKNHKDASPLGRISNAELRRIYKLCNDPSLSSDVREIAKKTFKFAHVVFFSKILGDRRVKRLERIAAPWEDIATDKTRNSRWIQALEEKRKKEKIKPSKHKAIQWRNWLKDPLKAQEIINSFSG
ncbi:MAG: hypothetical protein JSS09_04950, partial [Verrucomicrobia bacterium]|nr:hypothetical protein [Verrucomicrobiota bacterium]